MIRWKVKKYIEENQLCHKSDKLLIGISGGADSVALLRLLLQMGYHVEAAHCNFQLRGDESERDEQFVRDLCHQLQVVLHVKRFETVAYATEQKISVEMAARDLRYAWFKKLLEERLVVAVAVAHHQEDNAETVLLNLIRGTGISGLCGMQPKNGSVIRPLLDVSREEIEEYLQHLHQSFVTDSTNLEDNCVRNKIRLNILSEMQTINPSVIASIVNTANRLNDARRMLDKQLEKVERRCKLKLDSVLTTSSSVVNVGNDSLFTDGKSLEGCKINIHQLQFEVSPRLLLYHILSPYGFNSTQIEEIYASLTGEAGKLFESPKGWTLLKDRNFLLVRKSALPEPVESPDVDSFVDIQDVSTSLDIKWNQLSFHIESLPFTSDFKIPHKKNYACLDVDRLPERLFIRHWRQGDRFTPFGMTGTKLISDYMTDCKFSLFKKEGQTVLVDEHDHIVWLIGERIDDHYKVGKTTDRILLIQLL